MIRLGRHAPTKLNGLVQHKILREDQIYSAAQHLEIPVIRLLTVNEIMDNVLRSNLNACEHAAGAGAYTEIMALLSVVRFCVLLQRILVRALLLGRFHPKLRILQKKSLNIPQIRRPPDRIG